MKTENPQKMFQLFPGIWVVLGVLGLIGLQFAWGWAHYPHQIKELARKLSSADIIQKAPVVNHAQTMVGIIHTTEQGVGVFLEEIQTKEQRKLFEVKDVDYAPAGAWVFGWSPDDKVFAFSFKTNQDIIASLHFINGSNGADINQVDLPDGIQNFAWLSGQRCAYIGRSPLLVVLQNNAGVWQPAASWPMPDTDGKPKSLLAEQENVVAWATDGKIWEMDIRTGQVSEKYSAPSKLIKSISYARDNAAFLTVENTNHSTASTVVQVSFDIDGPKRTLLDQKASVLDARWLDHGRKYAIIYTKGVNGVLALKSTGVNEEKDFFSAGNIWEVYSVDDSSNIFALAAKTSEPPGIWECDESNCVRVVSPFGAEDFKFDFQPALAGMAKFTENGHQHLAAFDLVPPANFSRDRKYPLIIGTASYEWSPIPHGVYAQCLSHCGAFVALVNYRWDQKNSRESVDAFTNNMMAVYDQLLKNPNVDKDRVYLFGFSAGTFVLSDLVQAYPHKWKGLMLLNPSQLPEGSFDMKLNVLAVAGSGENEEDLFEKYQTNLLTAGIPMSWHIHADTQHVVRNKKAMYERALWMTDLIFGGSINGPSGKE